MSWKWSWSRSPPTERLDLEGFAKLISSGKIKNIITMVGAGISTAAGIPDFRSPSTGIYDNLEEYNLSDPIDVFSLDFFNKNPKPFFEVARRLYHPYAKPTLTHYFITLLAQKGLLRRHFTQNVDRLERISGLPESKLVEAHGSFHLGHCQKCRREYDFEFLKSAILAHGVPKCTKNSCGGTVKPDVVLFGEGLPRQFTSAISPDFEVCDMLIIMGTSLTVMPFCGIINCSKRGVPRLLINRHNAGGSGWSFVNWVMKWMVAGFRSNPWRSDNKTDLFVPGDADDTVLRLAKLLGWEEELLTLQRTKNEELEKEFAKERAQEAATLNKPNAGGI